VAIPGKSSTSGTTHVVANWTIVAGYGRNVVRGTCSPNYTARQSDCTVGTLIQIDVTARLYDVTNGSVAAPSNSWAGLFNQWYFLVLCTRGACTVGWPGPAANYTLKVAISWDFYVHGMKAGHAYQLLTNLFGYVDTAAIVDRASLPGAPATAWLDVATAGNAATLLSVAET
jgi:hypothetical protein